MIDWEGLRAEYITGNLSFKALSMKHNMHYTTLQRKATADGWYEQRRQYRIEAASRAIADKMVSEVDRLRKIMTATETIQDVVLDTVIDPEQFNRHLVQNEIYDNENGVALRITEEKVFDKVDTKAVRDMTSAIKDLVYCVRNLYKLPTQAEEAQQRIAAERLAMDRKKAEADETADKTIHVVMQGAEEYAK